MNGGQYQKKKKAKQFKTDAITKTEKSQWQNVPTQVEFSTMCMTHGKISVSRLTDVEARNVTSAYEIIPYIA